MTTIKSSSENTRFVALYKSSLKGMLPIGIISAILFGVIIPLVFFVGFKNHGDTALLNSTDRILEYYIGKFQNGIYLDIAQAVFVLLTFMALALFGGLMQNSYLHSKSKTDLYHALPIKRSRLFAANFLAFLTATLLPFLAIYLLTMVVQLLQYGQYIVGNTNYFQYIAMDILGVLVVVAAVYLFTSFVAVNVGTSFDSFALTGLLGILPLTVWLVSVNGIWASQTYGATEGPSRFLAWLSPFTFGFMRIEYMESRRIAGGFGESVVLLLVWAVLSVVLYFATLFCYNRRKSEIAEQAQPDGVFQIIAKCFAAYCGSALFYAIFYHSGSIIFRSIAMVIGGLLIGIIAELILSRGVRAFKRNLKWLLGAGGLCCLVAIACNFDFIGFETRLPDPAQVESLQITYRGRMESLSDENLDITQSGWYNTVLTEPESIAAFTDFHRQAVSDIPPHRRYVDTVATEDYGYFWINLEYKLKNGRTLSRRYNEMNVDAIRRISSLENKRDFIAQNHALFFMEDNANRMGKTAADSVNYLTLYNAIGGEGKPYKLSTAEYQRIIEAARQDMLDEPLEEILSPSGPAYGYMELQFENIDVFRQYSPINCTVIIGRTYKNTMAVLTELGMADNLAVPQNIDEIVFTTEHKFFDRNNAHIAVVTPQVSSYFSGGSIKEEQYRGGKIDYVSATDPAMLELALTKGFSQAYADPDQGESRNNIVEVFFFSGGKQMGATLLRLADLPADIQAELRRISTPEDDALAYAETTVAAEVAITATNFGEIPEVSVQSAA